MSCFISFRAHNASLLPPSSFPYPLRSAFPVHRPLSTFTALLMSSDLPGAETVNRCKASSVTNNNSYSRADWKTGKQFSWTFLEMSFYGLQKGMLFVHVFHKIISLNVFHKIIPLNLLFWKCLFLIYFHFQTFFCFHSFGLVFLFFAIEQRKP